MEALDLRLLAKLALYRVCVCARRCESGIGDQRAWVGAPVTVLTHGRPYGACFVRRA
jgi:hypothetical protein